MHDRRPLSVRSTSAQCPLDVRSTELGGRGSELGERGRGVVGQSVVVSAPHTRPSLEALLEGEDTHLGGQPSGRVGDTAVDQGVGHGRGHPDALEGVALLQLGAGGDGRSQSWSELAVEWSHLVRGPFQSGGDGIERGGAGRCVGDPLGEQPLRVSCPATSSSRLSGKCRKNVLFVTPARSVICATVVSS